MSRNGAATKELPALAAVADDGEIPGFTRRHKFADLYHEHTNYQFIKHSPPVADPVEHPRARQPRCAVRQGVEPRYRVRRRYGLAGHDGRRRERATPRTSATSSARSGSPTPRSRRSRVRATSRCGCRPRSSRTRSAPSRTRSPTRAALEPADVQFVRNEDGSGTFTFSVPKDSTVTQESVQKAMTDDNQPDAVVTVDGQNLHGAAPDAPDEPRPRRCRRPRQVRGRRRQRGERQHRRSHVGRDREPEGAASPHHLLHPAHAVPRRSASSGRCRRPRSSPSSTTSS